ncbi:hypothetical protein V8E53_012399 [Lactarius tabidus]
MSRSTISQAPHTEKKAHKKWTMKEMQMLVKGCNCISHGIGNWKVILNVTSLHFDNLSLVDLKDQ